MRKIDSFLALTDKFRRPMQVISVLAFATAAIYFALNPNELRHSGFLLLQLFSLLMMAIPGRLAQLIGRPHLAKNVSDWAPWVQMVAVGVMFATQ